MGMTLYARTYQETAQETPDQRHALVLLAEAIVRFLHQAREAIERRDYHGQCDRIIRAQRILSTLMASLDHSVAPELTAGLWGTYNWMHSSLTEVSIRDDVALLDEVLEVATHLCETWRQARQQLLAQEAGEGQANAA